MESFAPRNVSRLTRHTMALILAGGRGPGLHDLTRWRSEPALFFGGKHRVIDFPLSNCVNSGIRRIGVLTQFGAHTLVRHLIKGWRHINTEVGDFIDALPASQRTSETWYAGTADAIYQNLDLIRMHNPELVLVMAGDQVYKMDYGPLLAYHVTRKADLTVGCIQVPVAEARQRYGVMTIDDDARVQAFTEKPDEPAPLPHQKDQALASMSIYVFNTGFLFEQLIRDADTPNSRRDFARDILPHVIRQYRVFAYPFQDPISGRQPYWRGVGTVEAYWRANIELVGVSPELNLYDDLWPIRTYQLQLPPAKFEDMDGAEGMAVDSMVSGGCRVSGGTLRHSLLFSNVQVKARSHVEDSVLLPDVVVGEDCRIHRAVVESGTRIPPGTVIGLDPETDRKVFHVTPGGVVLVTPECDFGPCQRCEAGSQTPLVCPRQPH